MEIQPYLIFNGRCQEAIDFYREAVGAEVQALLRYKDSPEPPPPGMIPPGTENNVMHANLRIGDSTVLMSDGTCQEQAQFQGFSLTICVTDAAEADRVFQALAAGGQVRMPLCKTFFSPRFGMLTDRFGVSWMVYLPPGGDNGGK